uniref:Bm8658 n=1 Tax=Brugia malayi TaxID=6279 RepID=A0A0J9Y9T0_BRUMA|nr:Bm8658 [Brugia malayi]
MHKASDSRRLRSPDGLKSSVFKAIRNVRTTIEDDMENIRCPFAKMEDDLEIGDFRIFASSEMNEEKKLTQKLQEKNHNEVEEKEMILDMKVGQIEKGGEGEKKKWAEKGSER